MMTSKLIYCSFNRKVNFEVMSLNEGLCDASPSQQRFIRSTSSTADGSSNGISGIGGYGIKIALSGIGQESQETKIIINKKRNNKLYDKIKIK